VDVISEVIQGCKKLARLSLCIKQQYKINHYSIGYCVQNKTDQEKVLTAIASNTAIQKIWICTLIIYYKITNRWI